METRKKIGLFVLFLVVPLLILLDHIFLYPIPLKTLPFAIPCSVAVVSLFCFSHVVNDRVMIPITLLLIGFFVIFPSTLRRGIELYPFMIGTIFILMGLATTLLVVALSYKK